MQNDDASRESRLNGLEPSSEFSTIFSFYDSLPPVSVETMIGSWRGNGIATGHPFDGLLERFGWYGKHFRSAEDVDPLVFQGDGKLFAINPSGMPLGLIDRRPALAQHDVAAALFKMGARLLATK